MPNAYQEIAEKLQGECYLKKMEDGHYLAKLDTEEVIVILREALGPLVEAATGWPMDAYQNGCPVGRHLIADRFFYKGPGSPRIYCVACLRTALEPFREPPKEKRK